MRSGRMEGSVLPDPNAVMPGSTFYSPLAEKGLEDIENCTCISALYFNPQVPDDYEFSTKLLPGARLPPKALTHDDYLHVQQGGRRNRHSDRFDRNQSRYIFYLFYYLRTDVYQSSGRQQQHSRYEYSREDRRSSGGFGYSRSPPSSGYHGSHQQSRQYQQQQYYAQDSGQYGGYQQANYASAYPPQQQYASYPQSYASYPQPQEYAPQGYVPQGYASQSMPPQQTRGNLGWNRNMQRSQQQQPRRK